MSNGIAFGLKWTSVSVASEYRVYFGSSATSLSLYTIVNALTVTAQVYNLNPGTPYYWSVAAIVGGNPVTGATWSFKTPGTAGVLRKKFVRGEIALQ